MSLSGIYLSTLLLLMPFFSSACAAQHGASPHQSPSKHHGQIKQKPHSQTPSTPSEEAREKGDIVVTAESPYRDVTQIAPGEIAHLRTGHTVSETQMIDLLATSRIVYVGEVHDSVEDHRLQLKILKGLVKRYPGQMVVGMEMFRNSSQPLLDLWIAGERSDKEFLKRWYEDWSHDDGYYRELLQFIKDQRIPIIALRPSTEMSFKMRSKGIDGLSDNDKRKLPTLDAEDPFHKAAVQAIFKGHGPGASSQFDGFYKMMLFWEETMAEGITNYLSSEAGQDKKMMVMAGGFHVGYGFGLPRRAFRRLPESYQIVMSYSHNFPEKMKMQNISPPNLPLPLADFIVGVEYAALKNQKVRLGVMLEQFQSGVQLGDVFPDSPADKAGLKKGDIITEFDGASIQERFDLIFLLQGKKPGDRVEIKVIREGMALTLEATMAASGHP